MKLSLKNFRERFRKIFWLDEVPPFVRRVVVAVIGGTVLLVGIAMIVLPGPAVVVIPLGLAVLATEFLWAKIWLRRARKMLKDAKGKISSPRPSGKA